MFNLYKGRGMKQIIKIYCILVLALTVNMSCNDFLEIDSSKYLVERDNYYASEKDLDAALRGAYSVMANMYSDYLQGRMGLEADEGFITFNFDAASVSDYTASSADVKILGYWRAFYNGINLLNALLENIDKPVMDADRRAQIKGQALFLRGYFYFMLVNKFGGVPIILQSTKSGSEMETQVPRASIREVYDRVLWDMMEAADLLKNVTQVQGGGELSKSAAWGILARVNLYMAGEPLKETDRYEDALYWALKVMETGHHELNGSYEQVFINYAQDLYDTEESIWEVEFWGNGTGLYANVGGKVGLNNGIYNTQDADLGISQGLVRPSRWIQEVYAAGDLRKDWNTPNFKYQGNPAQRVNEPAIWFRYVGKFRRESEILMPKSTARSPQNAPLLRYSDVLLMYAEALNEVNQQPNAQAIEAVNQVRRRAFGEDVNTPNPSIDLPVTLGYDAFRKEIRDERARELCFEGLRKNDLIRWGLLYENIRKVYEGRPTNNSLVAQAADAVYRGVGYRDIFWPIPAFEMNLNKQLAQNPGW